MRTFVFQSNGTCGDGLSFNEIQNVLVHNNKQAIHMINIIGALKNEVCILIGQEEVIFLETRNQTSF